jgi:hypothetical protein
VTSVTGGTDLNRNIWGQAGSEIDGPASIVGLDVSTGAVNVNVANYFFGQVVTGSAGLGNDIFIVDISSEDTITVRPIDAAGNVIGNFSLVLGPNEFEPLALTTANLDGTLNQSATSPLDSGSALNNLFVSIVAFDLSDFVGTGILSGVAGVQIDGGGSFDPSVVGFTSVPEPGLALLLGAGLGAFALARRRA